MSDTTPDPIPSEGAAAIGYALLMADVEGAVQAASDQIALLGRVVEQGFAGFRAITPAAVPPRPATPPAPDAPGLPDAFQSGSARLPPLPGSRSGPGVDVALAPSATSATSVMAPMLPAPEPGAPTSPGPPLAPSSPATTGAVPFLSAPPSLATRPPLPAASTVMPSAPPLAPCIPPPPSSPPARIRGAAAAPVAFALPPPFAPVGRPETAAAAAAPAASPESSAPRSGPNQGDVFLDGVRVGHWMADHLARSVGGPSRGSTAFDPRLGPRWPGALQGY